VDAFHEHQGVRARLSHPDDGFDGSIALGFVFDGFDVVRRRQLVGCTEVRERAVAEQLGRPTGEGGEVDDDSGTESFRGIGEDVGENESSFGVRVVDLYGLAVVGTQDVSGADRVPVGHVLHQGNHGHDVTGAWPTAPHDVIHDADHHGRPGLVHVHVLHVGRGLDV